LVESQQAGKHRIQELEMLLESKNRDFQDRLQELEQAHGEASVKMMREYEMKLLRQESKPSLTNLQIETNASIPNSPTSQPSPAITPNVDLAHLGIRICCSKKREQHNIFCFAIAVKAS
jgi:hypothetical protein